MNAFARAPRFPFDNDPLPAMTPIERQVFEICETAADAGKILPSNDDIAARIGSQSSGGSTVAGVLKRLTDKGYITHDVYQRGRQVTIVATGRQTAPPACTTPHWRKILERAQGNTPTLPRHTIANTLPTLRAYLEKMMREENITFETAQLTLMARGMQQRESERG